MTTEHPCRTFISYSRADKEFAIKLAQELKSAMFPTWLDQFDIPAGARWDNELEKALNECEIFLVILTPASAASENVKDEIGYAIDSHKRILPVLLENCAVPLRLRRFQYVDFTAKTFNEGIESAKQRLTMFENEINQTIPPGVISAVSPANDSHARAVHGGQDKTEPLVKRKAKVDRQTKLKSVPAASSSDVAKSALSKDAQSSSFVTPVSSSPPAPVGKTPKPADSHKEQNKVGTFVIKRQNAEGCTSGTGGNYGVWLDKKKIGTLANKKKLTAIASVGIHSIYVEWMVMIKSGAIEFVVTENETTYLVCGQESGPLELGWLFIRKDTLPNSSS